MTTILHAAIPKRGRQTDDVLQDAHHKLCSKGLQAEAVVGYCDVHLRVQCNGSRQEVEGLTWLFTGWGWKV